MSQTNSSATTSPTVHSVTLDYIVEKSIMQSEVTAGVKVDPDIVRVRKGDTLQFRKGLGPERASVRITFSDPGPFSAPTYEGSNQVFRVTSELASRITYKCELIENGNVVATSDAIQAGAGTAGGNVEPAAGDRGAT